METENQKKNIFITKGATNWLFVVLVALIAGAVGGALTVYISTVSKETVLLDNQSPLSNVKPRQAVDGVSWLDYHDDVLGLEFKYPAVWGVPVAKTQEIYRTIAKSSRENDYFIEFSKKPAIEISGLVSDPNDEWANLDQPSSAVMELGESEIFFQEKITVANQKTALKTGLSYLDEGSGISINTAAKILGQESKYKFIVIDLSYFDSNMEKRLGQYYDIDDNTLNKNAIIELKALQDDTTTDQEALNNYKLFKQWVSTFKFIEPQGQGSANMQESGESAIKPILLSRDFDSKAVFGLFNDYSNDALATTVEELHKCGDALDCQVAVLKNAGAGNDAIEFYRQSDGGVMTEYKSYGSFALVNILYPFAANDNDKYMILSGKNLWCLERTDITKVTGNESVAKEFPSPDEIWFQSDNGGFIGQNKNGELVFVAGINAGCHVCATGYAAIINYKVDPVKEAVYAEIKGFCTQDILIDGKFPVAKYPACSAGIGS